MDVVLDCVTKTGKRTALLIEVKLSEQDFNGCSAWLSPKNDRLDVCDTSGPFGNDPAACFQLRNHDREHRRRYDTALGPLTVVGSQRRRWVLVPLRRQPGDAQRRARSDAWSARGRATARWLRCARPERTDAIWRRWAEAKSHLAVSGVALADLTAEEVVRHHEHDSAMRDRYLLDQPLEA